MLRPGYIKYYVVRITTKIKFAVVLVVDLFIQYYVTVLVQVPQVQMYVRYDILPYTTALSLPYIGRSQQSL